MADRLLIDTDVIIDYLRGFPKAVEYLEKQTSTLFLSSITIAELYAGVKDGEEKFILDQFIEAFEIVDVTTEIAIEGGLYKRDYIKSHGVGLADSIIAACAILVNAALVTLNKNHFPMIKNVIVPYRKR